MKKDFANSLNNLQRFAPILFLSLDETKIDGKTILWCFVPPSSQVVMFGGKIYDRGEDGDMDITRNSEMVSQIHRRKSAEYLERKIFPYAKESDFDFARLMPKVRLLATTRYSDHPWAKMTDMEIIKSAGLYEESIETGEAGYNLAAVLLFGRDEVIKSCTANYVTDTICRRDNLDRYDDRLMVTTNLIDAYEQLNDFTPLPKNPVLALFFINIGRADVLGSGVRSLYEYTKIYSGGEPELIEGDVFKTIVPLDLPKDTRSKTTSVVEVSTDVATDVTTEVKLTPEKLNALLVFFAIPHVAGEKCRNFVAYERTNISVKALSSQCLHTGWLK